MGLRALRWILATALVAGVVVAVPAHTGASPVTHPAIVSANPNDDTPHVLDGRVNDMVQIGDRVVLGGKFTQVRNQGSATVLPRTNAASFLASTGELTSFAPALDRQVNAVVEHPDGHHVFLGGEFTTVDGIKRRKVVKIDLETGSVVTAFKAAPNGKVMDLAIANDRLYVGGAFKTINGVPREGFAAVDLETGAVDPNVTVPFTVPAHGTRMVRKLDITPDGSRLVAIGNFTIVGGLDRYQIAVLDLSTIPPSVANWQTNRFKPPCYSDFDSYVRDVDIAPDGTWFVVTTTGGYGSGPPSLCDSISRWDLTATGSGLNPTWIDFTGGDSTYSAAIVGDVVYIGGHERWHNNMYRGDSQGPFAIPREGIAALSSQNGVPFTWDPGRKRGVGVFALVPTDTGLWVGNDTNRLGNEFHGRVGFFPLAGGSTPPASRPYRLPNDLFNISAVSGGGNGQVVRRSYDEATMGSRTVLSVPSMANARGAFALNGKVYTGWSDGRLYVRSFDGSTFGAAQLITISGIDTVPGNSFKIPGTSTTIPRFSDHLEDMTGMFYDAGRLYYTVSGHARLYMRYFNPESDIIGAELFVASTGDGVSWSNVRGMTLADGELYYALTDRKLYRIAWTGSKPTGAATQVGGSGTPDDYDWTSRGIFVFPQSTDTNAPTVPGTPSGTSTRIGEVDLEWSAASDTISDTLTYRIYRDGAPAPIGQIDSPSTTTVAFTDTVATPGGVHTYTVDARDVAGNASATSLASEPIPVFDFDTTPPEVPGTPVATPVSRSKIDLTWAGSTDDRSSQIDYRIFRDDEPDPVGEVTSADGIVSFTDTGLEPASTHTYTVDATDEAGNASELSDPSEAVTTFGVAFADDFSSGDLSAWTDDTRMSIDLTDGSPSAPSARVQTTAESGFAYVDLLDPLPTACASARVNVVDTAGSALDLIRLRTAGGGAITKVYLSTSGVLTIRNDAAGGQQSSGTTLPGGWNEVELCGTPGTGSAWDLFLNGGRIVDAWATDTNVDPVGRVQIGDTASKTITAAWDDVVVDTTPG